MNTETTEKVHAWTTEYENAVIWGTHDIEEAKTVYRDLHMDTEPDWEDFQTYWGRPGLDEQETWETNDFSDTPGDERQIPFLIFEF